MSLTKISPVVPVCTPSVFPSRSAPEAIVESSFTIISCFDVVYVSEKSTLCFLSSVAEIPAIPTSALPDVTSRITESKAISSTSTSSPSFLAISSAISISIPTILSPSWYSYGGNSAFVATISFPDCIVFTSPEAVSPALSFAAFVSAVFAPPHATKLVAINPDITNANIFFFIMSSICIFTNHYCIIIRSFL